MAADFSALAATITEVLKASPVSKGTLAGVLASWRTRHARGAGAQKPDDSSQSDPNRAHANMGTAISYDAVYQSSPAERKETAAKVKEHIRQALRDPDLSDGERNILKQTQPLVDWLHKKPEWQPESKDVWQQVSFNLEMIAKRNFAKK